MKHAFSVDEFCQAHGISRGLYYKLSKEGRGPAIMKINTREDGSFYWCFSPIDPNRVGVHPWSRARKNNDEYSREVNQSNGGDGKSKRAVRGDKEPRRERGQC